MRSIPGFTSTPPFNRWLKDAVGLWFADRSVAAVGIEIEPRVRVRLRVLPCTLQGCDVHSLPPNLSGHAHPQTGFLTPSQHARNSYYRPINSPWRRSCVVKRLGRTSWPFHWLRTLLNHRSVRRTRVGTPATAASTQRADTRIHVSSGGIRILPVGSAFDNGVTLSCHLPTFNTSVRAF
ncbi:hypothetical protein NMY22_g12357 [Coprinellus aureogranulatus]|nr:hypothetical protein NMY22_g12357 [Coprinellus aureogranulatus]